jgi:hypothetical protein
MLLRNLLAVALTLTVGGLALRRVPSAGSELARSNTTPAGVAVEPPGSAQSSPRDDSSEGALYGRRLANRAAYVPPQCFTKTQADDGNPKNPCYVCHTRAAAPNYVDDEDLQLSLRLPKAARKNPWTNLFSPAIAHAPLTSDEEILAYVRQSNYLDWGGGITLARVLEAPPESWDLDHNHQWDGYVPDVQYRFDRQGFDRLPDGTPTGWRAFAYYPFPGTFFPTNGSADDVLIRLDPALREDQNGHFDATVYVVNLAIVEALMTRADVAIDPVDETALGADIDFDGHLGHATRVAFRHAKGGRGRTELHYVGRARALEEVGQFPIAVGLFPIGTEFFHTVRYLDVGEDGAVTMAPHMKEVRYARKSQWFSYDRLRSVAAREARETAKAADGTHRVPWAGELGVTNDQGWQFQGFIEAKDGSLRPQSMEESTFCEGCHGGIGATTDSVFSFARKLGGRAPARGWFHWSQRDLRGIAEPKRQDGQFEYALYLRETGGGDEFRSNAEVSRRFFDERGDLRAEEVEKLHADISRLLLPSAARALDLDRAYRAVVLDQSFDRGRDAVLASSPNVLVEAVSEKTGIERPVVAEPLAR